MGTVCRVVVSLVVTIGVLGMTGCGDNNDVPPPPSPSVCGNNVIEPGEECDNGGLCIGGKKAGATCGSENECGGSAQPGVCIAGAKIGTACQADTNCPDSVCQRCVPFGGDGCAANCTFETDVTFDLVPGVLIPGGIQPGTSGVTTYGQLAPRLPIPLSGRQTLTIGKERDGSIPGIIKAASVVFPKIQVASLACACVRGFAAKTCGGTIFDADGQPSPSCGEGIVDPTTCPAAKPCAFVNGPGNSASGFIGCGGLDAIDTEITQDCQPDSGGGPLPPQVTLTGSGPAGSAILLNTTRIGTQSGSCTDTFCTDADPVSTRGNPTTLPYTTGSATATVFHAGMQGGSTLGPHEVAGTPFDCSKLTQAVPTVEGGNLAAAFTSCASALGDIVLNTNLVAGTPNP